MASRMLRDHREMQLASAERKQGSFSPSKRTGEN